MGGGGAAFLVRNRRGRGRGLVRQACGAGLHAAAAGHSHQVILGPGHDPSELRQPDRKVGGTGSSWRPGDPKEGRKGPWNRVSLEPLIACLVRKAWLDPMADLARGLTL